MDPSNFSQAVFAYGLGLARVAFNGALVEAKRRPCGHRDCPYWAWLVDTDIKDGRRMQTYRCDAETHDVQHRDRLTMRLRDLPTVTTWPPSAPGKERGIPEREVSAGGHRSRTETHGGRREGVQEGRD
jgi:hypothetical protein